MPLGQRPLTKSQHPGWLVSLGLPPTTAATVQVLPLLLELLPVLPLLAVLLPPGCRSRPVRTEGVLSEGTPPERHAMLNFAMVIVRSAREVLP